MVGREAAERLEPGGGIVGGDEVGKMRAELVVALVVEALTATPLMARFIRST